MVLWWLGFQAGLQITLPTQALSQMYCSPKFRAQGKGRGAQLLVTLLRPSQSYPSLSVYLQVSSTFPVASAFLDWVWLISVWMDLRVETVAQKRFDIPVVVQSGYLEEVGIYMCDMIRLYTNLKFC